MIITIKIPYIICQPHAFPVEGQGACADELHGHHVHIPFAAKEKPVRSEAAGPMPSGKGSWPFKQTPRCSLRLWSPGIALGVMCAS